MQDDRGSDSLVFFFFNDTATTEIYTLSLHDALPIGCASAMADSEVNTRGIWNCAAMALARASDRKSTRLNSSYVRISYAVFCLKKKKKTKKTTCRLIKRKQEIPQQIR